MASKSDTPTTPPAFAGRIVIVSGQEFSLPLDADLEAVRGQLTHMGFADVASATISKGTRKIDGATYETVEFVKQAGRKGSRAVIRALCTLPAGAAPRARHELSGSSPAARFLRGELTVAETLENAADIHDALDAAVVAIPEETQTQKGAQSWDIPAIAVGDLW